MAEKNGRNKTILYLVSVIIGIVIFTAMPTMAGYIISNDKESRERDIKLGEKDSDICERIYEIQSEILQRLTRIETKLES